MKTKILHSLKWSALSEIVSKTLPPIFYILTARILTPEDFGVVATSTMILAFATILWEAGFSKALIQTQNIERIDDMSNIVFYTNVILGIFIYMLLYYFSSDIALFFNEAKVEDVIKVSGLAMIIGSFSSVQTALLQKNFGFKKLFYSRLVGSIVPGSISVVMAYQGYGYWSLIIGSIVSIFLQAVILWKISDWRPSFSYDISLAKKMINFSKWVLLSALLSWFFAWGDLFVIGYFFTPHEMGLYRTGNYFVVAIIGLVTAPIVPVMYSYFSKIQHDKQSVRNALLLSSKFISFFVLPIGLGIYLVQVPLSSLIFGDKWMGVEQVIGYLALMHSISWIIGLNNEAYKAVGRPDIETKILIFNIFFYFIVYMITAQISFELFLIARMFLAIVATFVHIYASKQLFNIGYLDTIKNIFYIVLTLTIVFIVSKIFFKDIVTLQPMIILLLNSVIMYNVVVYIFDRKFINQTIELLIKRKN